MSFKDYLDEVIRHLPNSTDSAWSKAIKLMSIADITKSEITSNKIKNAKKNYVDSSDELLFSCMNDPCISNDSTKVTVKIKEDYSDRVLNFIEVKDVGKYICTANGEERDYRYPFYLSKDFNYEFVGNKIYKKYSNKIFIEKVKEFKKRNDLDKYNFIPITIDDKIFEFSSNKKAISYLQNPGTYLFYGEPGTGKSSFIFSDTMKDKKIVSMLANVFCDFGSSQIDSFFKIFNPDILLLEEFDKAALKLDSVLLMFERLRQKNFTIVLTANNLDRFDKTILRPKRIDKIVKFDVPKNDEIKNLIDFYSKYPENNNKLFDLLNGYKFSHAYIVDLSKKMSSNFEETKDYVDFLKLIFRKDESDE